MTVNEGAIRETLFHPPTPIPGGFCVRRLDDDRCVDVLRMLYNWRLVTTYRPTGVAHDGREGVLGAWCYFGHGVDEAGQRRTMRIAYLRAVAAALTWDGSGDPPGFDKNAITGATGSH
ncbi:hypothetical protein BJY24_007832 [Nocardia transvalensis]|uniref:Uncharacterized protein n=1 Tax=Nocardia transvalensis TaxID=37333 RepID=A0A7W9PMJ0_9NOCA|nr:hypothetical protein [Nocardia transvalensis]MBB5918920.1 hypothetical protein [Nocardia transvalensis]